MRARVSGSEAACQLHSVYETHSEDAVLDRLLHGQLPDVHRARLAQPVRAVERLVLEPAVSVLTIRWLDIRRVPPQVHQDDVVTAREVETRAAGLERNEDDAVRGAGPDRLKDILALVGRE